MGHYAWAVWLAAPIGATALAAVLAWWRGRPRRVPGPKRAMAEHRAFLDALAQQPRGTAEPARAEPRRSPSVTAQARSTVTR